MDGHGQVIDVYVSARRDIMAPRQFFSAALTAYGQPDEVVTDRAPALKHVIDELLPAAFHNTEKYANNRVECDHGRLKARLRPMRGLKTDRTARVVIRGHALLQNIRRGHYALRVDARNRHLRVPAAFDELAGTIHRRLEPKNAGPRYAIEQCNRAHQSLFRTQGSSAGNTSARAGSGLCALGDRVLPA